MGEFVRMKGPDGQEHLAMIISAGSYEVDASGKPLLRVVDGAPWAYDPTNDLTKTSLVRRESVTIQTHNAVSVGASGSSTSPTVLDLRAVSELCIGFGSDASHTSRVVVAWYADSAGVVGIGSEAVIASGARTASSVRIPAKAPFAKVQLFNEDATARTMSSWTTLIP